MLLPARCALVLFLLSVPALARQATVSQGAINQAVDRGVDWLLDAQRGDGSWGEHDLTRGGHRDSRNDLTAFCLYTLLKCKLGVEHPAVRRALLFLEQDRPRTTYAIASQVLALCATGEERYEDRVEMLVEDLLELRWPGHGTWGYPGHPSIQTDLSNTQYAALALRAAHASGVSVPKKVWHELAERVLLHQEEPHSVEAPGGQGTATQGQAAGFAYLLPNPASPSFGYNVPNASMTSAGLALLRIAEEGCGGRMPRSLGRSIERSKQLGRLWLDSHYSVETNVAGDQAWIYYYLYGIERIGALYDLDQLGGHDWYWEGATELLKRQEGSGNWKQGGYKAWPRQPMPHANTCFALLFLVKATRGGSTGEGGSSASDVYAAEDPSAEVHVRASGRAELAIWVSGFGDSIVEDFSVDTPDAHGMFVHEVRYLLDGVTVASRPGSELQPWKDERFAVKHSFRRNGRHELLVEVEVRDDAAEGNRTVLRSPPMVVHARDVLEDWMLESASFQGSNVLDPDSVSVSASSHRGEWTSPDRVIDGMHSTRWLSKAGDARPTLSFEFQRRISAKTLVLIQADTSPLERGRHARVKRVAITVNDARKPFEAELAPDPARPTRISFPKRMRLRRLSIRVLDFEPGSELEQEVGFAEVGLLD